MKIKRLGTTGLGVLIDNLGGLSANKHKRRYDWINSIQESSQQDSQHPCSRWLPTA